MHEIVYVKKNSLGFSFFSFPQKDTKYTISLFGYDHNYGEAKFPFKGDIVSNHTVTGKFLKVGCFFISKDKRYIVLAFNELGILYGLKDNKDNYILIDEMPTIFAIEEMKKLEIDYQSKKLDINTQLYHNTLK